MTLSSKALYVRDAYEQTKTNAQLVRKRYEVRSIRFILRRELVSFYIL